MTDIRPVTDRFATAPQLRPEDLADAKAQGYRLVVNNRPDAEEPGQPTAAEMERAATAQGLAYIHLPVGPGRPDQTDAMRAALATADGPVVAFCRSGTRSITTWARGQAAGGERGRDELLRLGREAGYDLSGAI